MVNTIKCSSSVSAISDDMFLGNYLSSLGLRFSSPPTFLLYYGKVGPDQWLPDFLDLDYKKKHTLHCE